MKFPVEMRDIEIFEKKQQYFHSYFWVEWKNFHPQKTKKKRKSYLSSHVDRKK